MTKTHQLETTLRSLSLSWMLETIEARRWSGTGPKPIKERVLVEVARSVPQPSDPVQRIRNRSVASAAPIWPAPHAGTCQQR